MAILVAAFYHVWLQGGLITAGDWPYFTMAGLKDMAPFPSIWNASSSTGTYDILAGPMFPLQALQGLMALLHVDWVVSERLVWIYPALIVPCVATYALSLSLFRQHLAAFVSALAVVMNSYVFVLYQGGQFGVAMAYGCMPLVVWAFVRGQRRGTIRSAILTGTLLAVQALYDIRSTYMTVGVLLVCGAFCAREMVARGASRSVISLLRSMGWTQIALALVVLATLHLWWILPALFVQKPALPPSYTDVAGVHALSLMQLGNSLSLFHPFWFAKTVRISPINPLFFGLPLLIFGVLLRNIRAWPELFLMTIALIAAFLVKGDNNPAGGIYDWLFVHLPGFSYFRDSSKFYQPLALVYALLLGAAAVQVRGVSGGALTVGRRLSALLTTGIALALAMFPTYPALFGQAAGTFAAQPLPADYARFNSLVDRQRTFFRVLWVPARPRFGTASALHPALDATQLGACCLTAASTSAQPWPWLHALLTLRTLQSLSVRYIVVPDDTASIIGQPWPLPSTPPAALLAAIRSALPTLRAFAIGHLHVVVNPLTYPLVFAVPADRPLARQTRCAGTVCVHTARAATHLWVDPSAAPAAPTAYAWHEPWYTVRVQTAGPIYLVQQQTYDPKWLAFVQRNGRPVSRWSTLFARPLPPSTHVIADGYANAWLIREPGTYMVVLDYWPQTIVLLGLCATCIAVLTYGGLCLSHWAQGTRL